MRWFRCICCMVVAAVVLFVVGVVFHLVIPVLIPAIPPQFENQALFRPWQGWTSSYMLIHPLWFGGVFGAGYLALKSRKAFPPGCRGGLVYGFGVFIIGSFPVFSLVFASFQVSPEVILTWISQSCCQYVAAGMTIGIIAGDRHDSAHLDSNFPV